jgi:hypothetical protein
VLQTKELLDVEDTGKQQQQWDIAFTISVCPSPKAYTLALQQLMLGSSTVTMDWQLDQMINHSAVCTDSASDITRLWSRL